MAATFPVAAIFFARSPSGRLAQNHELIREILIHIIKIADELC